MSRYVYFARQQKGHYIKIGVSDDPKKRTAGLGLDLLRALEFDTGEVVEFERGLHRMFDRAPVPGREWFEPTPFLLALIEDPSLTSWPA